MNKIELITAMANETGFTKKEAEAALVVFQKIVKETLITGDKLQIMGFGIFEVTERAAREGRNPRTSEEIIIPASKALKFKASKILKEAINSK